MQYNMFEGNRNTLLSSYNLELLQISGICEHLNISVMQLFSPFPSLSVTIFHHYFCSSIHTAFHHLQFSSLQYSSVNSTQFNLSFSIQTSSSFINPIRYELPCLWTVRRGSTVSSSQLPWWLLDQQSVLDPLEMGCDTVKLGNFLFFI